MNELNIKSSTIEQAIDLLKGFLDKAIGPAVDEWGAMLADNVKLRRFKNQIRNLEKAKKIAEERKISIRQINLKALVPYLEGVSMEEDETLQEMWANLFVNYLDSEKNLTINVYPDILKQLSTNEVVILKFMEENDKRLLMNLRTQTGKNYFGKYSLEELGNLDRLGLIREEPNYSFYDGHKFEELQPEKFYLTEFAEAFLNACK